MPRLSRPIGELKPHYEIVVVGSGYGGGITASRLARAGRQVCVLERGREFQPGEYPDTELETLRELQADTPRAHIGSRTGLYDFRVNEHINVFLGCGLGGTSLVNANVSLPPEPRVMDDSRWPQAVRDDIASGLADGFRRAIEMLKPTPYPTDFPRLPKLEALERSAGALHGQFSRPPINVSFTDGVNHVGVEQHACILCGDCVTGCNHGAKNTVLMNYLPDARNHGAEIFTEIGVRRLERQGTKWVVHYQLLESGREAFDAPELSLTADLVVLAAGTLGSTELLLRSRASGVAMSDHVGARFTGNGDVVAFSYNSDQPIDGVGFGARAPEQRNPVGPCITGLIDLRDQPDLDRGMVIEEGSLPGPIGSFLPAPLAGAAAVAGEDTDTGVADFMAERRRELESMLRGPYHGAVQNTQTYLVMTHDNGAGKMALVDDRLQIDWPDVGKQPIFQEANDRLRDATRPLGGTYLKNPLWSQLMNHRLVTVHPLGGCVMAEEATRGVVNHKGQIFSSASGSEVYENLYVSDGSVIPRPLGVNPLLTISALAERCCALLAKDRGWQIRYDLPSQAPPSRPATPGLRFTERMRGYFSTAVTDDFRQATDQGKQDDSPFMFTLTVISTDVEQMLTDRQHAATLVGTVQAPVLSTQPLSVSDGRFNLLAVDPSQVDTRRMRYQMTLTSREGETYFFDGFKEIKDDRGLDTWADTTTLFITVHDGVDQTAPVLGRGILEIRPDDFLRQMSTMEVTNADSLAQRLELTFRFGTFFGWALLDIYGGVFSRPNELEKPPVVRKRRPLRMSAPEVHHVMTADRTIVRLVRYKGGTKGPVVLAPGYGTSTLAFTIDTVDTNLPEFLFGHGYDVWLFDYRASPALPSSGTQFTIDDIATRDYPAAIGKVREITRAPTVQVMAHCIGSMSFLMAMMAGLRGVRSAVCSSLAFYPITLPQAKLKADLDLGAALAAFGLDTLTTDFDPNEWRDKLLDAVTRPAAAKWKCDSAVCRRILLFYGEVYKHEQLNEATHRATHEMFGVANLTAFNHIALMVRKGQIVDHTGKDAYLPHVDRLAIPIRFLHGAENRLFLPEGTSKTLQTLAGANDASLYMRVQIADYAHMDLFIGKNAARDVYPEVLAALERYN